MNEMFCGSNASLSETPFRVWSTCTDQFRLVLAIQRVQIQVGCWGLTQEQMFPFPKEAPGAETP